jgi:hypothetical protein
MGGSDKPFLKIKSIVSITFMKQFLKHACLLAIVCAGQKVAQAQKTENLHLQSHRVQIPSSIFSKVEVIDARFDVENIGFVQRGGLNRKVPLTLAQPLKDEMASVVSKLIDGANKQEGTLLINIRSFNISELTSGLSEKGTFAFDAGFYIKQGADYRFLFSIDSSFMIKAGGDLDVTTKLLDTVPEVFAGYINLAAAFDINKAGYKLYTADEMQHLADVEKKEIPIYSVDIPKKGLYTTYEDFKNNRPREDVFIENRKGFSRPFIYELKENGKKGAEIKHKYYYVVSDGEKMFVSNAYGLYPLTKRDNDFFFTGVGKDDADVGTVVLAGALMGILGGAAASKNDLALFEFRIDHATGNFIAVKKLKD